MRFFLHICRVLAFMSFLKVQAYGNQTLNDSNFQTAINLWFSNQTDANATYGHISDWNVSSVTDMSQAFQGKQNFNENISNWDVSNVTDMSYMFASAELYQDIVGWDVSSVTNMSGMFSFAVTVPHHNIGDWNVSAVTDMSYMFSNA